MVVSVIVLRAISLFGFPPSYLSLRVETNLLAFARLDAITPNSAYLVQNDLQDLPGDFAGLRRRVGEQGFRRQLLGVLAEQTQVQRMEVEDITRSVASHVRAGLRLSA